MIKPTKYTNINTSVVGLSAEIIKTLKENHVQKYGEILGKIISIKGLNAKENFLLAMCFLFSVGKIRYYQKEDVIEYIGDSNQ